jgi:hypothetical protein
MSNATKDQARPVEWVSVAEGDTLPPLSLPLPYSSVVLSPAFTKDPYPGHFDVSYIQSFGHPTVFLNTMSLIGIFDRYVTDWAGPDAFIREHALHMIKPTYAGQTIIVSGSVQHRLDQPSDKHWGPSTVLVVAIRINDQDGTDLCEGSVTVAVA